jgi:hypothetical protein
MFENKNCVKQACQPRVCHVLQIEALSDFMVNLEPVNVVLPGTVFILFTGIFVLAHDSIFLVRYLLAEGSLEGPSQGSPKVLSDYNFIFAKNYIVPSIVM